MAAAGRPARRSRLSSSDLVVYQAMMLGLRDYVNKTGFVGRRSACRAVSIGADRRCRRRRRPRPRAHADDAVALHRRIVEDAKACAEGDRRAL